MTDREIEARLSACEKRLDAHSAFYMDDVMPVINYLRNRRDVPTPDEWAEIRENVAFIAKRLHDHLKDDDRHLGSNLNH